jgi:hypothetical protein
MLSLQVRLSYPDGKATAEAIAAIVVVLALIVGIASAITALGL